MTEPATSRTAGRPRSSEADQAILETALQMLREQGYDAMSMEGVANAAGVGKTTIYRRYPGKRELVIAALSSLAESMAPLPETGSVRGDMLAFIKQTFGAVRAGPGFAMLGTLLVKERDDPALMELFRAQVLRPRMEIAFGLLRRGVERGELRPDFPVEIAVQMIAGSVFTRHISGLPEDDAWLEATLDMLLRGIGARSRK